MDQLDYVVKTFDANVNKILQDYVKKPTIIKGIVHLLLMLYVVRLAPQPPKPVLMLFENIYFKLFIFSLVLWTAQFSPSTSLLIALAFLVTMNYVNTGKVWEYLENVDSTTPQPTPVSQKDGLDAVQALADAAAAPVAAAPDVVMPVAEIAMGASTTPEGVEAVKTLAEGAVVSTPTSPEVVSTATMAAVQSIMPEITAPAPAPVPAEATPEMAPAPEMKAAPAPEATGCYPMRNYDMSLVTPQSEHPEDYYEFTPTPQ